MLIISILSLILSIAACERRDKSIHFARITLLIITMCIILVLTNLDVNYLNNGIGIYGGLYHVSSNTQIFNIFIYLITGIVLLLSAFFYRNIVNLEQNINKLKIFNLKWEKDNINNKLKIINLKGEQYNIMEYPVLLLFIITGGFLLMSTSDLVSIFLSIELQSYGLYILSTVYRNSESGTKGGLVYFLLGGLSSSFILLATALLYCNTGATSLDGLYVISSISDIIQHNDNIFYESYYISLSLLILSIGFLFKVSSAPFHNWSPDVYDALPTIVTTFVAIIAKISIFIFLLQLVHYTNYNYFDFSWTSGLLLSCLLSMLIGTIGGLQQFRLKRLFAYSTISHVGFILLALSINSVESIQAFLFYIMQYSLINLNAFFLLITIGYSLYYYVNNSEQYKDLPDKINSPIQLTSQIKGYFYINPLITLSLAITIFSLVGIPPLIGFFGKQMVLSAGLDNSYVFIVLIAIITSVISAVYYLNIIKQIYFDSTEYTLTKHKNAADNRTIVNSDNVNFNNTMLSNSVCIIISLITLIILLFMFSPEVWLSNANILALILFNH